MRHAPIAAALLFVTPAFAQDATPRYQLDISVVRAGTPLASLRTQIMEDAESEASAVVGETDYRFESTLRAIEGDGSDTQLLLEANLTRGEEQIAAPRLTVVRGEEARIVVGDEAGDLLSMTLTPLY